MAAFILMLILCFSFQTCLVPSVPFLWVPSEKVFFTSQQAFGFQWPCFRQTHEGIGNIGYLIWKWKLYYIFSLSIPFIYYTQIVLKLFSIKCHMHQSMFCLDVDGRTYLEQVGCGPRMPLTLPCSKLSMIIFGPSM